MINSKHIILCITILSLFKFVFSELCDKCISRDFSAVNYIDECSCNDGYYCNEDSRLCERCNRQYFVQENFFTISKGKTITILKEIAKQYNFVNVHHLVKKLHELSSAVISKNKEVDEDTSKIVQRNSFMIQKINILNQNYNIVEENVKSISNETNNPDISTLLKQIKVFQTKYKDGLPKINSSFVEADLGLRSKMDLLQNAINNLSLPNLDWFNLPSTYYLDEISSKIGEQNTSCTSQYEEIISENREKLLKILHNIRLLVELLFTKAPSIQFGQLLVRLNDVRDNFHKITDLSDKIIRKKKQFDTDIVLIYKLLETVTKIKQLFDDINKLKLKMSASENLLKSTRKELDDLDKRLARIRHNNKIASKIQLANQLFEKSVSIRNAHIPELDIQKLEKDNRCLELKLNNYIECLQDLLKTSKELDTGCLELNTVPSCKNINEIRDGCK